MNFSKIINLFLILMYDLNQKRIFVEHIFHFNNFRYVQRIISFTDNNNQ
jgi:hypothetical protein